MPENWKKNTFVQTIFQISTWEVFFEKTIYFEKSD